MIKKYPNIILLGAPGSGKGTLAQMLVKELNYEHLSTGDMFRQTAKEDTPFGRNVKALMETGHLISDDITNEMTAQYINKMLKAKKHFILDGYPRTKNQAAYLEKIGDIDFLVIFMDISSELAIKRISGRRSCPNCHQVYNIFYAPSKSGNLCEKCGTELFCRKDDNAETAKNRFKVYINLTEPLIAYYKKKGNLVTLKVTEKTDVLKETLDIIKKFK